MVHQARMKERVHGKEMYENMQERSVVRRSA